jgi:hypothetical protein
MKTTIGQLITWLEQIPDLYENLPRYSGIGHGQTEIRTQPKSTPPLKLEIADLTDTRKKPGWRHHDPGQIASIDRFGVLPSFAWWTATFAAELAAALQPCPAQADPATVRSECAWLANMSSWISETIYADLFCHDIQAVFQKLSANSNTGISRPRCDKCPDHPVLIPKDRGTWHECPACKHQYTPNRKMQNLVTVRQAVEITGTPEGTIRSWITRKRLMPAGKTSRGKDLYNLHHVINLKTSPEASR